MSGKYLSHNVQREIREDGSIILRSGYGLSDYVSKSGDWLDDWAARTPDAVFIAERSGPAWREVSYGQAREMVRALASSLLARGLGSDTPIMILSGNGVDHGLLSLAAQYAGIPTVPLAEQYSLIPAANGQITYCADLVKPKLVFADDAAKYAGALALDVFEGVEKVASRNAGNGVTSFEDLLKGDSGVDLDAVAAKVGPDTVAKYLMTSGSTSNPKAVITTQRMICANQSQIADAMPFLRARPPRIVDWLPWNHVFGGSHNFNMMLANGGSLYIDAGKPVKALVWQTIENNRLMNGTLAFNVPVGFAMLRDAMREDAELRQRYFSDLDMIFYAGASLPQDVWADLEAMSREVRGDVPLMTSSWGMTETAPACLIVHEPTTASGIIGVPMTGCEVKLIPDEDMRCDLRVRGPNITPGYFQNDEKTQELFDEEGFLISGDAVKFVDAEDINLGLRFDGRISEDFKLMTGTWVRAANLRLELLGELAPLCQDIVICGADKSEIGLFIFPSPEALAMADGAEDANGALTSEALSKAVIAKLEGRKSQGSASRISRALVLSEPPSMGDGEMTAKGNLNFRKILTRRAGLLARLYDDADQSVIHI